MSYPESTAERKRHDVIEPLFSALRITDRTVWPYYAQAILRCLRIDWVAATFGPNLPVLRDALAELAKGAGRLFSTKGLSDQGPARALLDYRPNPPGYIEQLRGILLLGLVSSGDGAIARSFLERMASLINGLTTSHNHSHRTGLTALGAAEDRTAVIRVLAAEFAEDPSDRARDMRRVWIPLLSGQPLSRPRKRTPPGEHRPSRRRRAGGRTNEAGTARLERISRSRPRVEGSDPDRIEIEMTEVAVSIDPGEVPDSERYEIFYAERAGRRANLLLLDGHIDTLLDEEAAALASILLENLRRGSRSIEARAARVILLMLATGCTASEIQDMEVAVAKPLMDRPRLMLDLASGCLWRPVLFDHAPVPGQMGREHWVQLPLPDALLEPLQSASRYGPTEWLPDNPESALRDCLARLGPSARNLTLGRIRHWLSVAVQANGRDLAATMLICGDTFARSTAPLYYYCPPHAVLESIYRSAVWPIFGAHRDGRKTFLYSGRVGFPVLVSAFEARAAVTALRRDHPGEPYAAHNRRCDEVAGHFCVITGHRPTDALFQVRRWDLGLEDGLAILADKRVDAAHWLRPVALSPSLCHHLRQYLDHLGTMAESATLDEAVREHARRAINGDAGLFFHVDPQGSPVTMRIGRWREQLPEPWKALRANWYRCYLSMTLREAGVEASAVMIQLGHLEAADYPLSRDSPMCLLDWCAALRPRLEVISRQLGMHFEPVAGASRSSLHLEAVDWAHRITLRERGLERIRDAQLRQFRIVLGQQRDALFHQVSGLIRRHDPVLADVLEAPRPREVVDKIPKAQRVLGQAAFEAIVESVETASEDPLISVALRSELARVLRRARKSLHWETPRYAAVALAKSADPTPLIPRMMLARDQVLGLRRHWIGSPSPSDFIDQLARAVLGLILWGPPMDCAALEELLQGLTDGYRPRELENLALIPTRGAPQALRGYAALVAARLRTANGPIDLERIEPAVACQLPPGWPVTKDPVNRLLALSKVNAILEQSPLARLAAQRRYCSPAPAERQVAFLTGALSPPPFADATQTSTQPPSSGVPTGEITRRPTSAIQRTLNQELRQLQSIIRVVPGEHKVLPLTGTTVPADRITRRVEEAIVAELDAFRTRGCAPVIDGLAAFVRSLLVQGTVLRREPALATVRTYLGSVARRLVRKVGSRRLQDIDPDDFIDCYNEILAELSGDSEGSGSSRRGIRSAARAGAQLLAFHRVMVRECNVAPIDVNELMLDEDPRQDDLEAGAADFVSEGECRAVHRQLAAWASGPLAPDPDTRRAVQAAAVQLVLMFRGGLRIQESACLLHEDLAFVGDHIFVTVRNNGFRRMKNPLRRRLVVLDGLDVEDRTVLQRWHHAQAGLLAAQHQARGGLFTQTLDPRSVYPAGRIRQILGEAFTAATGRRLWPHLLRHSAVCRAFVNRFPVQEDTKGAMPGPRDVQRIKNRIGHVDVTTTLGYFHLPWLLANWQGTLPENISARQAYAALSGRSKYANDKLRQRRGATTNGQASGDSWMVSALVERSWPARSLVVARENDLPVTAPDFKANDVQTLESIDRRLRLLAALNRSGNAENAALGWSMEEVARIRAACASIAEATGYDVLGDPLPRAGQAADQQLGLGDADPSDSRVVALGRWFLRWYRTEDVRRQGAIFCPPAEARDAAQALRDLGCDPTLVLVEPSGRRDPARGQALKIVAASRRRGLTANLCRLLAIAAAWERFQEHSYN